MTMRRTVGELIERDALVSAPGTASVEDAAAQMAAAGCGSILVVDGDALTGIFTERDLLLRVVGPGLDPARTRLREVMTRAPDTIAADAPVADAVRMMDEFSYRYLPVLDGGRIVGVLSMRHLPFADVLAMQDELAARHAIVEHLR